MHDWYLKLKNQIFVMSSSDFRVTTFKFCVSRNRKNNQGFLWHKISSLLSINTQNTKESFDSESIVFFLLFLLGYLDRLKYGMVMVVCCCF